MIDVRAHALERLVEQFGRQLTPETARTIADFRVDNTLQDRIDFLADRNAEGLLNREEREELEAYVSAASFLSILQAQARSLLRTTQPA